MTARVTKRLRVEDDETTSVEVVEQEEEDIAVAVVVEDFSAMLKKMDEMQDLQRRINEVKQQIQHGVSKIDRARGDGMLTLFTRALVGARKPLRFFAVETVAELKARIQDRDGVPPDQQRLLYNGVQLGDNRPLLAYAIASGSNLHFVLRLRGC